MNKLYWDAKSVFGLPGMPEWVRHVAIDLYKNIVISDSELSPTYGGDWIGKCGRLFRIPLETDFTGDWKDSLLERPQEVNMAAFVKAWDEIWEPSDIDENVGYGFIRDIKMGANNKEYYLITGNVFKFSHVRVMNPPTRRD